MHFSAYKGICSFMVTKKKENVCVKVVADFEKIYWKEELFLFYAQ